MDYQLKEKILGKTKNIVLLPMNLLYRINPNLATKVLFKLKLGYDLNLDNPQTYNEKLQWIKLNYKNPILPYCTDKFHVRDYVKEKGLNNILNELYWEGFDPKDIPFNELPEKFVIKVTHGSGLNIIVQDKNILDKNETIKTLNKWLKYKYLPCYGEWFYSVLKPRIIVEKYLGNVDGTPADDYKFFCFNGQPKYIYVMTDRHTSPKKNFYDLNWNYLKGVTQGYPNDNRTIEKPKQFNEMYDFAKKLSEDFPHVRVDFFIVNGNVYFGELTFTTSAGLNKIKPIEFDYEMGSHIILPLDSLEVN